jgi:hypothetical protein
MKSSNQDNLLQIPTNQDPSPEDYLLVRAYGISDDKLLDDTIENVIAFPSILPLEDGSHEIVVLKSFCAILQSTIRDLYPSSIIDRSYDPLQPTTDAIQKWGYDLAANMSRKSFDERADTQSREGLPLSAKVYAHIRTFGMIG